LHKTCASSFSLQLFYFYLFYFIAAFARLQKYNIIQLQEPTRVEQEKSAYEFCKFSFLVQEKNLQNTFANFFWYKKTMDTSGRSGPYERARTQRWEV